MDLPSPSNHRFAAVYARVSTARQEEDGTIETQLCAVRELASKAGLVILKEYVDEGWSGDTLARPQLDQLRTDARGVGRAWSILVIYDPDRLARRYSFQELVMDELREAGIDLLCATVSAPKNPEEKILFGVRGLFSEYERAKIAERFRFGKLRSVKEGNVLTSCPPYGYIRTLREGRSPGKYVVNEREALVVRRMFSWIADEGLSIRQISRRLHEQKILPRKSQRGVWQHATIIKMLRNEAYVGRARWNSTIAVEPKSRTSKSRYRKIRKSSSLERPRSEWMYVSVPALVDETLFRRAQQQLLSNRHQRPRNSKYEYLLTGKIFCACGRRRVGQARAKGKYLYYDCTEKLLRHPLPRVCRESTTNARDADLRVWTVIAELLSSPEQIRAQIRKPFEGRANPQRKGDSGAEAGEVKQLEERERRFNEAYAAGLYSLEQLRTFLQSTRGRRETLRQSIATAKLNSEEPLEQVAPTDIEIEEMIAQSQSAIRSDLSFEEKREIISKAVDRIEVTQQHVKIIGHIPSSIHGGHRLLNQHCVDSAVSSFPFEFQVELPAHSRTTRRSKSRSLSDSQVPQDGLRFSP